MALRTVRCDDCGSDVTLDTEKAGPQVSCCPGVTWSVQRPSRLREPALPIVLEFSEIPPSANARLHWAAKAKITKRFREWACLQTLSERNKRGGVTFTQARVSAIFFRRNLGVSDLDNAVSALKACLDGIVDGGLIPNDTPKYLQLGSISEEHGPRGLRLVVEELA